MAKNFKDLTEREIVALAIALEEDDLRIRHRYMDSPLFSAMLQVMLGGTLVFIAGLVIGSS